MEDHAASLALSLQNLARCVVTRSAHHASARMCSRAAQVQSLDRRFVASATGHRAQNEHLIQAHLAVENIAAGESEAALEIKRRQHLLVDDQRTEARRVFLNQV